MQDKFFLENINYLFSQKKFEEVFLKIKKNSHFLKNYPDLFNISGVSQILKFNYNKSDVISALKAKDIMSKNPKIISADAMAIDAMDTMEVHGISQLLVEENGCYAGVVHLHDLIKEGII